MKIQKCIAYTTSVSSDENGFCVVQMSTNTTFPICVCPSHGCKASFLGIYNILHKAQNTWGSAAMAKPSAIRKSYCCDPEVGNFTATAQFKVFYSTYSNYKNQ